MLQLYIMSLVQTLILSVIEGITEFLPISSTGHLILFSNLLNISQTEFVKSFEIIIQLGAILAVLVIYFKKLVIKFDINLWKNIMIAFIPSAVFGLLFYSFIKRYLIGNVLVVTLSLLIGGIFMILYEKFNSSKKNLDSNIENKTFTYKNYLTIGIFQIFSMIPGVSRAFATIFGGMIVGMKKEKATEFSFFLAIPTMFAATFLDLFKTDLSLWTNTNFKLLFIGFIVSFLTAYLSISFLVNFVKKHDFKIFGVYRIILSILFLLIYFL